jgi:hypothetical protein
VSRCIWAYGSRPRSGQKTIVGIVADVKFGGLDLTAPPEVYLPYAQHPVDSLTVAARPASRGRSFRSPAPI